MNTHFYIFYRLCLPIVAAFAVLGAGAFVASAQTYSLMPVGGSDGVWGSNGGHIYNTNDGSVVLGSISPSGSLVLDVEGQVGASEYCDADGANCFSPQDVQINPGSVSTTWTENNGNVVRESGNVGIGNTTPTKALDVTGDINFTGDLYSSGVLVDLSGSGGGGDINLIGINSFVGDHAGPGGDGTSAGTESDLKNNFLGYHAGSKNTTGHRNNFIGYQASYSNTTGGYNNFLGASAGYSNTTGRVNTLLGFQAGYSNAPNSGSDWTENNFLGASAGFSNTTGSENNFLGYQAGFSNTTGSENTFLGYRAGYYNTTGNWNTLLGYQAGYDNTTGSENTFLGYRAGYYNTTGSYNIGIGHYSGAGTASSKSSGNKITNNSIFLGSYARPNASDETNQIVIGYDAVGAGSNTATLGNTGIIKTVLRGAVKIGQTFASCTSSLEGSLRYNPITQTMQFCNGVRWSKVSTNWALIEASCTKDGGTVLTHPKVGYGCFFSNGTSWINKRLVGDADPNRSRYSDKNFTYTVPAGLSKVDVYVVGGGSGAKTVNAYHWIGLGGGGAGGAIKYNVSVTEGQKYPMTIAKAGHNMNGWRTSSLSTSGGTTRFMGAKGGPGGQHNHWNRDAYGGIGSGGTKDCRGGSGGMLNSKYYGANILTTPAEGGQCGGATGWVDPNGGGGGGATPIGGTGSFSACGAGASSHAGYHAAGGGCVFVAWE